MHEATQMAMILLVAVVLVYSMMSRETGPFTDEYPVKIAYTDNRTIGQYNATTTARPLIEGTSGGYSERKDEMNLLAAAHEKVPIINDYLIVNRLPQY